MKNHEWTHFRHNHKNKHIPRKTQWNHNVKNSTQCVLAHVNRITKHHTMETRPHVLPICSIATRTRKMPYQRYCLAGWNHSMWIATNFSSHPQSQKSTQSHRQHHLNMIPIHWSTTRQNTQQTHPRQSVNDHAIHTQSVTPRLDQIRRHSPLKPEIFVTCNNHIEIGEPWLLHTKRNSVTNHPRTDQNCCNDFGASCTRKNACFAQCPMHTRSATELVVAMAPRLVVPSVTGTESAKVTACSSANHSQYTHEPSKLGKKQSI